MRKQKKLSTEQVAELNALAAHAPGGLLAPARVVAQARNKKSSLHDFFTWNNGEAAEQWRLHEAQGLIARVTIEMDLGNKKKEVRAFVSLASDRINGGGYRSLSNVLTDAQWRSELLRTALAELKSLEEKYSTLKELCKVWAAVRKVKLKKK